MTRTSAPAVTHRDGTDNGPLSHCGVALLEGRSVTFWTSPQTDVAIRTTVDTAPIPELALGLAPGRLVVVGRATSDCPVPYLDPAYRATPVVPDTRQSILHGNDPTDLYVSRAHFTLRSAPGGGVVLINGVPRVGGGVRPPRNGTKLVAPAVRDLAPGEEVLIRYGEAVAIRLPNQCVLQLKAN